MDSFAPNASPTSAPTFPDPSHENEAVARWLRLIDKNVVELKTLDMTTSAGMDRAATLINSIERCALVALGPGYYRQG